MKRPKAPARLNKTVMHCNRARYGLLVWKEHIHDWRKEHLISHDPSFQGHECVNKIDILMKEDYDEPINCMIGIFYWKRRTEIVLLTRLNFYFRLHTKYHRVLNDGRSSWTTMSGPSQARGKAWVRISIKRPESSASQLHGDRSGTKEVKINLPCNVLRTFFMCHKFNRENFSWYWATRCPIVCRQ